MENLHGQIQQLKADLSDCPVEKHTVDRDIKKAEIKKEKLAKQLHVCSILHDMPMSNSLFPADIQVGMLPIRHTSGHVFICTNKKTRIH